MTSIRLYDAHNHLQDKRLHLDDEMWAALHSENIQRAVVNGSCEEDWPEVLALAKAHSDIVLPSFGYHPWYVRERTPGWKDTLTGYLDQCPAAIGEIGLDCWVKDHDIEQQEEVFSSQLAIASERNLPVSIHCLQAWGRMLELLQAGPRPQCGFLLHSYGGPV